jgi:hypothetical protein
MYKLKLAEDYQIAFEQGNVEKAKKLLLDNPQFWNYMQARYERLLNPRVEKILPGCKKRFALQKKFLDNVVEEAGKNS